MYALLFVTLYFFFMLRNHEKYHWAYLVEKNKFFNHEQGTDTIPWELCGSIIIPWVIIPKKESKSAFSDLENTSLNEDESLEEDQPAKTAKQLLSPTCQPPLLALTQSPNFALLSSYVFPPPEKISGKPVATDWGKHFGFAIMNHFLSDEWRPHLIHSRKENFPDITKSYSLRGPGYSLVDTCKNGSSLEKEWKKKKENKANKEKST